MWQQILSKLDPSISDLFIVLLVVGLFFWVRDLKIQIKDTRYKYNVLNTWAFAADKMLKLHMLKTGNSQGDFMLDWDSIPTLQEKVNVDVT